MVSEASEIIQGLQILIKYKKDPRIKAEHDKLLVSILNHDGSSLINKEDKDKLRELCWVKEDEWFWCYDL
jgi:hypothetical protein